MYGMRQRSGFDGTAGSPWRPWLAEAYESEVGMGSINAPAYIRWVQAALNQVMGLRLPADGALGPMTRSAIRDFQARQGLAADGVPGQLTAKALVAAGAAPFAGAAAPATAVLGTQGSYFKDSPVLNSVALAPDRPVQVIRSWPSARQAIAATYNRMGGLMRALAAEAGIEAAAALAVWYVESGGIAHVPGKAIIRFENHLFYRIWGRHNEAQYQAHFRHGGYASAPGRAWEGHAFREDPSQPFRSFHGSQELEYRVLDLAMRLAGDMALECISIGGPQILISSYRLIGYASPRQMYDAFQAGERAHVLGFFDFCRAKPAPKPGNMLAYLRDHRWEDFARYYNGSGQVAVYGGRIGNAYEHARQLA